MVVESVKCNNCDEAAPTHLHKNGWIRFATPEGRTEHVTLTVCQDTSYKEKQQHYPVLDFCSIRCLTQFIEEL